MSNYFYKAIDWPHTVALMIFEGPSTQAMLHIAALSYAKTGTELTYEDIKAMFPGVSKPWPDPSMFVQFWPMVMEQLSKDRAKQETYKENGSKGGRPVTTIPKETDPRLLSIITLTAEAGYPDRKVKSDDREMVIAFLDATQDVENIISNYKNYLSKCNEKGTFPIGFAKWIKTDEPKPKKKVSKL